MAEAIKEISKQKLTSKTPKQNEDNENSKEINDENIEKRLKSLRSFVNNLEPSIVQNASAPPIAESSETETSQPSTSNNSNYYDMISEQAEKANQKESNQFSDLNTTLENIKIDNAQPVLKHVASAPQAPLVEDFNLDKIKQVNKLQYPKLNWNQLNEQSSIESDLGRFYDNDQLCKDLELYLMMCSIGK
ncbi:hypothetical protein BpHYR1_008015 [Brachionus plicatilis]|uniref:Uncharacterized protein n=1 Tax=Brachionus plicatilis TaxID=10195 RepID=A0A3M7R3C7_BRAPC|nr:hypothetical protein BpHYR1_008015 [Brachionus plicatilis]